MNNLKERRYVGRLIISVLTGQKNVREAIKLFPDIRDTNIECAYHALVHYAADEEMRAKDIEYREVQDDYLEFIAQTLDCGKELPQNVIDAYKPYYNGIAGVWENSLSGFKKEFLRFINIK
jgi:hypothetical protein